MKQLQVCYSSFPYQELQCSCVLDKARLSISLLFFSGCMFQYFGNEGKHTVWENPVLWPSLQEVCQVVALVFGREITPLALRVGAWPGLKRSVKLMDCRKTP